MPECALRCARASIFSTDNRYHGLIVRQVESDARPTLGSGRHADGGESVKPWNKALFKALLDAAPDAHVVIDAHGTMAVVNVQLERLFGYSEAELIGRSVEILLPERLWATHVDHRSTYYASPHARPMGAGLNLAARRRDGSEFPVEISLSPLNTDAGLLVVSAIRDVTERRRFEQTLQKKNAELEDAIQAKDRFLAGMSHELRTPLNAIIGFTGTLLMKLHGPLTAKQEKQLKTIAASGKHLLSLINDLLDLAKIGSGKFDLHLEPLSCQTLIQEVASSLKPAADEKGIGLDIVQPNSELIVQTDHRAVSQILINLLNNAIKFTEAGTVRIELSRVREDGLDEARISVIDTGIGMRAEDQLNIFQEFAQANSGSIRRVEGSGLGLHLSQRLAQMLKARITFASEPGKGSTFSVHLPLNMA